MVRAGIQCLGNTCMHVLQRSIWEPQHSHASLVSDDGIEFNPHVEIIPGTIKQETGGAFDLCGMLPFSASAMGSLSVLRYVDPRKYTLQI